MQADVPKAVEYLEKGAEYEECRSCLLLARLYYMGKGVAQDPDKAAFLLDIAREDAPEDMLPKSSPYD